MNFVDETVHPHRKLFIEVDKTMENLLLEEDTDHNIQITIDDKGLKVNIKFPYLYCLEN